MVVVDKSTIPSTSGKVIVLSAVGSVITNDVSKSLAVAPSNTNGVPPCKTAPIFKVPCSVDVVLTIKPVIVEVAIVVVAEKVFRPEKVLSEVNPAPPTPAVKSRHAAPTPS